MFRRLAAVGTTVAVVGTLHFAPAAAADPGNDPCGWNPICSLFPVLPNLDHDVDLTKDPHALSGSNPNDISTGVPSQP
jgi:hypothetical protein